MSGRDYEVGYGKPPKANQFKKGVSGNHKGTKPKPKDLAGLLDRELARLITIKENGKVIRVTKREAAAMQIINKAVNGDAKAVDILLKHDRENGVPSTFEITTKDQAIFTEAMARREKKTPPPPLPADGWGTK